MGRDPPCIIARNLLWSIASQSSNIGLIKSTHDLKRLLFTSMSLNSKKMFPIICMAVTKPKRNHIDLLEACILAADIDAKAKTSTATDKYIAHAIGLPMSYQLMTCDIEIMTTNIIGKRKEFLIKDSFLMLLILSKNFLNI